MLEHARKSREDWVTEMVAVIISDRGTFLSLRQEAYESCFIQMKGLFYTNRGLEVRGGFWREAHT